MSSPTGILPSPPGDFDDVGWHGDTGEAAAQGADDGAAFVKRDAVVASAAREVEVVQVVGFDAAVEQVVHKIGEGLPRRRFTPLSSTVCE